MEDRFKELAAPFPPELVKQRKGNFGKSLDYVETATVIQRLNEALDGRWSYTIQTMDIEPEHVVVRGRLSIGDTHREQYGVSRITRHRDTGEVVNIGDDLKSAASDALKKCASLAGVALYLYSDSAPVNGKNGGSTKTNNNGQANGNGGFRSQQNGLGKHRGMDDDPHANGRQQSHRIGNEQIARIVQTARDLGIPQKDVIKLSNNTYGVVLSQLTPAQADELITLIGT
ncbi:single-stranded DNA-binding protein DdrA [bacterium BMS3Bbin04]|nr:single-stranded DNA-binding protein DdrA [bacterium BMS3Bbin04]